MLICLDSSPLGAATLMIDHPPVFPASFVFCLLFAVHIFTHHHGPISCHLLIRMHRIAFIPFFVPLPALLVVWGFSWCSSHFIELDWEMRWPFHLIASNANPLIRNAQIERDRAFDKLTQRAGPDGTLGSRRCYTYPVRHRKSPAQRCALMRGSERSGRGYGFLEHQESLVLRRQTQKYWQS